MSIAYLGTILDIVVLCALAATIFYALRLNNALTAFRGNRKEFEKLIADLSRNVDQAHSAIINLKDAGQAEADFLKEHADRAKRLVEELKDVMDAGEAMAGRLEALAEKNRLIAQGFETHGVFDENEELVDLPQAKKTAAGPKEMSGFSIQDRDYDVSAAGVQEEDERPEHKSWLSMLARTEGHEEELWDDGGGEYIPEELQSRAERELYKALKRSGKAAGGRH